MPSNEKAVVSTEVGGKAIPKLIEVVSEAIGCLYSPIDKILHAYADVKADRIRAVGKSTLPFAVRAAERVAHIEERRQHNIERIVACAVPELPEHVSSKPVDPDWSADFFEQCKDIGNEHMQQIWARILAGEVANPGSFSRRTLSIVRSMSKAEAESFTQLCSIVFEFDDGEYGFVVPRHEVFEFIRENVISTSQEVHLRNIGLLSSTDVIALVGSADPFLVKYFGKRYDLVPFRTGSDSPKPSDQEYNIEILSLTVAGNELLPIAGAQPRPQFVKLWCKHPRFAGARFLRRAEA